MNTIFNDDLRVIGYALKSMNVSDFTNLVNDCKRALMAHGKIVVSGLGKNVPLCEKFVGTMISLGLPAVFMHTNSAVHGDMGVIRDGDVVILLTKSGETVESIHLWQLLRQRAVHLWLLTFSPESTLSNAFPNKLCLSLEHEGDLWDIVPNNSSIVNLVVLQKLAMTLAAELNVSLDSFRLNHPGGHIGEILKCRTH